MADLTINLDFIPKNLDGNPILGQTLAKEVGRLLCESKGAGSSFEKYQVGKSLFFTGQVVFKNVESEETKASIEYFKTMCNEYDGWSNEVKGQILEKFNQ